ncbi:ankyrin repeat-containing domain protein [Aspergillus pseudoustus]|uniref:Ankyrin repeat-containing domain protein n=1 Tax=Aspergillus pseudoustus TaxID=1810923 RepID=A0ABR4JBP5_9EURO
MGHEHIAILLLDRAADPDTHCGGYGSALQVALMLDSAPVVHHLVEKGANPNLNSGQYGTALQIAAERGNVEATVDLLLRAGAYLQPRECGMALELAAYSGNQGMIRTLLENGLDVDSSCRGHYETALWMAASQGHAGIVRLLLPRAPASGISNHFLGLASEWAAKRRHYDIVTLLGLGSKE